MNYLDYIYYAVAGGAVFLAIGTLTKIWRIVFNEKTETLLTYAACGLGFLSIVLAVSSHFV